jgi:hypothetical protein
MPPEFGHAGSRQSMPPEVGQAQETVRPRVILSEAKNLCFELSVAEKKARFFVALLLRRTVIMKFLNELAFQENAITV